MFTVRKLKKEHNNLLINTNPLITGIKTNRLLIIFLCLIAKVALVCGDCDIGTLKLNDFDLIKVTVSLFTHFL